MHQSVNSNSHPLSIFGLFAIRLTMVFSSRSNYLFDLSFSVLHPHTHTNSHTRTHIHTHIHIHIRTRTHTPAHTYTHTQSLFLSLSLSLSLTHTHSLSLTHAVVGVCAQDAELGLRRSDD